MAPPGTEDAIDVDVRRTVWSGTVPVMFSLAPSEVAGTATPRPLFVNVPRCTYFAAKPHELIREHFSASIPASGGDLWLEFNSSPIRWHYPVGVLYDLLAEDELPWSITVHFQNFPVDHIMKLGNNSLTRSFYMNSLKESTYVKQNSIKTINDFGIRESDTIWEGLYDGVFEKFWSIASATAPATTAAVPVRILRPNFPIMQFPCSIKSVEGETAPTLASTLTLALPDVPHTIPFSIQGISPPLDTPLSWLYQHLAHPDGFLYIVFKD